MSLIQTDFTQEDCCNCFITFFVPSSFKRVRVADKERFFCPNGHGISYTGKTEAAILREKIIAKDSIIIDLQTQLREAKRKPRAKRTKKI